MKMEFLKLYQSLIITKLQLLTTVSHENSKISRTILKKLYGLISTVSRLHLLQEDCLLFTTKPLGSPGTHLIDLRRMKG